MTAMTRVVQHWHSTNSPAPERRAQQAIAPRVSALRHALPVRFHAIAACSAVASILTLASPAAACPDCAVGRQARSEVWNQDFGPNLLFALLPFLLIGVICLAAERIGRMPKEQRT